MQRRNKHNCTILFPPFLGRQLHMWPTWGWTFMKEKKASSFLRCVYILQIFTSPSLSPLCPSPHSDLQNDETQHETVPSSKGWTPKGRKREEINKDGQFYHFTLYTQPSTVAEGKGGRRCRAYKTHKTSCTRLYWFKENKGWSKRNDTWRHLKKGINHFPSYVCAIAILETIGEGRTS